jgi:hypothetical protein
VPAIPYAVAGRNRLEVRLGVFNAVDSGTASTRIRSGVSSGAVVGGVQYTRYINESVAVTLGLEGTEMETVSSVGPEGINSGASGLAAIPVGVRWYPLARARRSDAVKPFIAGGIGPIIGETLDGFVGGSTVMSRSRTTATVGGYVRGGADFHLGRSFALGVDGGYNWMADFAQPVGLKNDYSGFGIGVGVGWLFGHGNADAR